jgi:hypothetical protein
LDALLYSDEADGLPEELREDLREVEEMLARK